MLQHIKILSPIILIFIHSRFLSQVKLEVNTIPTKVDVHLDGVNLGSSPIKNERITPRVHKFEIKKKGYAPLTYDLLINPAQAISLDFFLNPIYECKFKTEEKGLVFELNGEHRWDVDMVRLETRSWGPLASRIQDRRRSLMSRPYA